MPKLSVGPTVNATHFAVTMDVACIAGDRRWAYALPTDARVQAVHATRGAVASCRMAELITVLGPPACRTVGCDLGIDAAIMTMLGSIDRDFRGCAGLSVMVLAAEATTNSSLTEAGRVGASETTSSCATGEQVLKVASVEWQGQRGAMGAARTSARTERIHSGGDGGRAGFGDEPVGEAGHEPNVGTRGRWGWRRRQDQSSRPLESSNRAPSQRPPPRILRSHPGHGDEQTSPKSSQWGPIGFVDNNRLSG